MQAYQIVPGKHLEGLSRIPVRAGTLGPHDVRIAVRAVSLNFRDLMIAHATYPVSGNKPPVPCSDGAGEVIAVGTQTTRFRAGDRVMASFFPNWIEGDPSPQKTNGALGADVDGMLSQEVVFHEDALARVPAHLSYNEAATLPCAAVTAWNALFITGALKPGNTVLLQGTGGVSIFALQLAKAAGLQTIITSSSDAKLERAKALGANATINYRSTPEWQDKVVELTDGRGVDLVVDVGGQDTIKRSAAAVRMGGTVCIIGGLSGFGGTADAVALIVGAKRLAGIYVGSRTMLEGVSQFVSHAAIRPVIDRAFRFEQAREAYAHLESGNHFGKVVIEVG
jgi:NADPH:quinone reductase-like Zn-dependent oxidoreductase